jgi:hypothetical protein
VTLCATWRLDGNVHFASDSRLTIGRTEADIAIKVVRVPYCISGPRNPDDSHDQIAQGDLGMCFAGSASGSMFLKESIVEVLSHLYAAPGYTDTSMENVAAFVFGAYRAVSRTLTQKIQERGLSTVVMAGYCAVQKRLRVFKLTTTRQNEVSYREVLLTEGEYEFTGSGATAATERVNALGRAPTSLDFVEVLKAVIDDPNVNSVGGKIQYGKFWGTRFTTFGVLEASAEDGRVHYWRGPLDLHLPDFNNADSFVLGYPLIDLTDPDLNPIIGA